MLNATTTTTLLYFPQQQPPTIYIYLCLFASSTIYLIPLFLIVIVCTTFLLENANEIWKIFRLKHVYPLRKPFNTTTSNQVKSLESRQSYTNNSELYKINSKPQ